MMGAIFYRWLSVPIRWLYLLIIIGAIFEVYSILLNLNQINNLFLFHFYTIVEFSLLSVVLQSIFQEKRFKNLVSIVSVLFLVYLVGNVFVSDLSKINSQNRIIESCILISFCLIYIVTALSRLKAPYLERHPYFILISGLAIYFAGTVFVYVFSNQLNESNFMPAWTIHSLLNIFLKLTYTSVIWRSKRTSST